MRVLPAAPHGSCRTQPERAPPAPPAPAAVSLPAQPAQPSLSGSAEQLTVEFDCPPASSVVDSYTYALKKTAPGTATTVVDHSASVLAAGLDSDGDGTCSFTIAATSLTADNRAGKFSISLVSAAGGCSERGAACCSTAKHAAKAQPAAVHGCTSPCKAACRAPICPSAMLPADRRPALPW